MAEYTFDFEDRNPINEALDTGVSRIPMYGTRRLGGFGVEKGTKELFVVRSKC